MADLTQKFSWWYFVLLLNWHFVHLVPKPPYICINNCLQRRSTLTSPNDQQSGATDSCVAEDDLTCSDMDEDDNDNNVDDDDDDDDDSEPILGKWFAETLFPPESDADAAKDVTGDASDKMKSSKRDGSDGSVTLVVPQKGEPAGFVSLASHVFIFLNKHIVNCESKFVRNYIRACLTEHQVRQDSMGKQPSQ